MADANPSRPVPQRKQVDGVVTDTDAAPEAQVVVADEVEETSEAPAKPVKVKAPKVGEYNERGAQVVSVNKMWRSGATRVEYK